MSVRGACLLGALLFATSPALAQRVELRGYGLSVALGSTEGPYTDAAVQDVLRGRLMSAGAWGPLAVDLAYEQTLTVTSVANPLATGALLGVMPGRGDWLPLQGTLDSTEHAVWRHRLDRAALTARAGPIEATVGRQTVSWATTLFLTPADPFAPFDPADPFRDYRMGVDAARVRAFPSAFTEFDATVRLMDDDGAETVTALGRARTTIGRTDLAGWGGVLHDEPAFAAGVTSIVLDAAVRGEVAVRPEDDRTVVRVAAGADRSFTVAGRTLYAIVEYQHDGFGARSADSLPLVLMSDPYRRGELQVLGRDELMAQATYQVHPLVQVGALVLWNLGDGSVLLTPSAAWEAAREITVRAGLYAGIGSERTASGGPASEYGIVPFTAYVSGAMYF